MIEALERSREHLLAAAQAGRHGPAVLAHAAAGRVVAAWTLDPAPRDPARHVELCHATGRRHLRRLLDLPPGAEVRSPMTNQLFTRLTEPPASRRPIDYTAVETYTYTPRKPLRRVLDHALDHLEQIEQWQRWRRDGVVPTPTDGWVPSTVTIAEDRLPLTAADLDAWIWRIDQAVRSTGSRPTEAGRCDASCITWRGPRSSMRRRSTRRCPTIRSRATRRRRHASVCASPPWGPPRPTRQRCFPIPTGRSGPRRRWPPR
jgi:hypothetical protein